MKVERIALVSFHTCPLAVLGDGKAGGMNVYVRELATHLGSRGIQVDLFTRCHQDQEGDVVHLADGVRLVHLPGGPPEAAMDTLYSHLPAFVDEILPWAPETGYDLVHSHYWLSGLAGDRVAREWDVPHVITFHTLAEIKMRARAGEREAPQRAITERDLMAGSRLVIASSRHEKAAMVRLYDAPGDRIQVVSCGVDTSLFRPLDIAEARKRLGLNGEKVVIYVGRIEPIKGVELLVRSAAIMDGKDHLKVLVVGGDMEREGEAQRLKGLAEELGVEDVMEFVGVVDQGLLPYYYNAADVCVVPSYYESFGLVALEAMACGTPVVACRVGGLPAVVEHGRNGYLIPWRCPEPFADSLEVILSSKGLQKSMSLSARKRAEGMGWETVAEEIHRLYASL